MYPRVHVASGFALDARWRVLESLRLMQRAALYRLGYVEAWCLGRGAWRAGRRSDPHGRVTVNGDGSHQTSLHGT